MDIREISISGLRGKVIGFFSAMNGGKTRAEVGELDRAIHSGHNVMACNSTKNTRDGPNLVVNGRFPFPATQFNSADEIKTEYYHRMEIIMSDDPKYQGENGFIEIGGMKYQKKVPITVIGVDEINLFCLSEREAGATVRLMHWAKENEIYMPIAGLLYDFRQRPFGQVFSIMPYIDIKWDKKPVCKSVHVRKPCGEPASHTQRLWSIDFVQEQGLEELLDQIERFNFMDKDGQVIVNQYVAAPFFDKTLRIEEEKDGRVIYLPVDGFCARLPFKEETFAVYDQIVRGKNPYEVLPNRTLTDKILEFLSDQFEGWVENDKGLFVPRPYYRNRLGGYSPEEKLGK